jgi:hypothetical protein
VAGDHDVDGLGHDRGPHARDGRGGQPAEHVVAEQYFEQLARWLEASPGEPTEWQRAAMLGDRLLYVTPAELEELRDRMREMLDEYVERDLRPELRPADARLISWC